VTTSLGSEDIGFQNPVQDVAVALGLILITAKHQQGRQRPCLPFVSCCNKIGTILCSLTQTNCSPYLEEQEHRRPTSSDNSFRRWTIIESWQKSFYLKARLLFLKKAQ